MASAVGREASEVFVTALGRGLSRRFSGHWHPAHPWRGQGHRALRWGADHRDPLLTGALNHAKIASAKLPRELTMWIDPGDVSVSVAVGGAGQYKYAHPQAITIYGKEVGVEVIDGRGQ
jgi:hypothetical protein